jgi:hypothetical protein
VSSSVIPPVFAIALPHAATVEAFGLRCDKTRDALPSWSLSPMGQTVNQEGQVRSEMVL